MAAQECRFLEGKLPGSCKRRRLRLSGHLSREGARVPAEHAIQISDGQASTWGGP